MLSRGLRHITRDMRRILCVWVCVCVCVCVLCQLFAEHHTQPGALVLMAVVVAVLLVVEVVVAVLIVVTLLVSP